MTSALQAMYTGANNGFLVRDVTESSVVARTQVYSSREGADPPQLVITFG